MEQSPGRAAVALVVERNDCPTCGVPAGSPCRTRGGDTAHRYHTQRLVLAPESQGAVEVLVPADRGPGQPWKPAPAATEPLATRPFRIGYAWCPPLSSDDVASQLGMLESAHCDRIFSEETGSSVKQRPELDKALELARTTAQAPARQSVLLTVAELRWLARTSAELMTLAAHFQAEGIRLELLAGPLAGLYDPQGAGSLFFSVLATAADLDRGHVRSKALEGQRTAAANGRHSGRPKLFDDDMLALARTLRDQGVSVPEIAARLTVKTGKNAGQHPSLASVYRALAEAEATSPEKVGLPR
jgi:DNA invertase Pin-like site-specific DNA recombinase